MDVQWYLTTPIAVLFTCIEDCKLFSKAVEEPFTENYILFYAYLVIEDTRFFNLPCDTWRDKPTRAKKWKNFKLFFTKDSANIKHHTTGSVGLNDEAANAILQLIKAFAAQQQGIENMRAVQEQPVNSAS